MRIAHLEGDNVKGADLEGAYVVGSDFEGANLFEANLHDVAWGENTICPDGSHTVRGAARAKDT